MQEHWLRRIGRVAPAAVLVMSLGAARAAPPEPPPLVVAVSLNSADGASFNSPHQRLVEGASIYLKRINANGGVDGRRVEIVTLDDGGQPTRLARNIQALVREHHVVAMLGCAGDVVCHAAAETSAALGLPLIGALSGSEKLTRQKYPLVFRVRTDLRHEADAMARQLTELGSRRIALLSDSREDSESDLILRRALEKQGMAVQTVRLLRGLPLAEGVKTVVDGSFNAAVLNVGYDTIDRLVDEGLSEGRDWPPILFAPANGSLSSLTGHFQGRTVGFIQVVPHPEIQRHALSREFGNDSNHYVSNMTAYSPEGMEGYLSARLLVAALRKAGAHKTPARLAEVLQGETWNFAGFTLNYAPGRSTGSDWVEVGLRSRSGALIN